MVVVKRACVCCFERSMTYIVIVKQPTTPEIKSQKKMDLAVVFSKPSDQFRFESIKKKYHKRYTTKTKNPS